MSKRTKTILIYMGILFASTLSICGVALGPRPVKLVLASVYSAALIGLLLFLFWEIAKSLANND